MSNTIHIEFMTDEAIETIKANIHKILPHAINNPASNAWVKSHVVRKPYQVKKYTIEDFTLDISLSNNYKDVDFDNSIKLYENLKHLPRYVLADERFWAWLNFEKFYPVARQALPITQKESSLLDHYLFGHGTRRSLFFGVLSRCFLRVYLTVDESQEDKYALTRFAIENPERIRNLTWRSGSNNRKLVRGVLKGEIRANEEFGNQINNDMYQVIAKEVYKLGSVKFIDAMSEDDFSEATYNIICNIVSERSKVN